MPRLRYIEESEKTPYIRALIESAKRTGAPDPRVVSLMTRAKLGIGLSIGTSCSTRARCHISSRRCAASRFQSRINAAIARLCAQPSQGRKG